MQTFGDEAGEPFVRLRDGVGMRDADGIEAERARFALKLRRQLFEF